MRPYGAQGAPYLFPVQLVFSRLWPFTAVALAGIVLVALTACAVTVSVSSPGRRLPPLQSLHFLKHSVYQPPTAEGHFPVAEASQSREHSNRPMETALSTPSSWPDMWQPFFFWKAEIVSDTTPLNRRRSKTTLNEPNIRTSLPRLSLGNDSTQPPRTAPRRRLYVQPWKDGRQGSTNGEGAAMGSFRGRRVAKRAKEFDIRTHLRNALLLAQLTEAKITGQIQEAQRQIEVVEAVVHKVSEKSSVNNRAHTRLNNLRTSVEKQADADIGPCMAWALREWKGHKNGQLSDWHAPYGAWQPYQFLDPLPFDASKWRSKLSFRRCTSALSTAAHRWLDRLLPPLPRPPFRNDLLASPELRGHSLPTCTEGLFMCCGSSLGLSSLDDSALNPVLKGHLARGPLSLSSSSLSKDGQGYKRSDDKQALAGTAIEVLAIDASGSLPDRMPWSVWQRNRHTYPGTVNISLILNYFRRPDEMADIVAKYYNYTEGRLGKGMVPGVTMELVVNVDEPSKWREWMELRRNTSAGRLLTPVFSHNIHEVRGYNRLAAIATSPGFLLFVQDDDYPPENPEWIPRCHALFKAFPRLGVLSFHSGRMAQYATDKRDLGILEMRQSDVPQLNRMIDPVTNIRMQFLATVIVGPYAVSRQNFDAQGGFDEGKMGVKGTSGIFHDEAFSMSSWGVGFQTGLLFMHHPFLLSLIKGGTRKPHEHSHYNMRTNVNINSAIYYDIAKLTNDQVVDEVKRSDGFLCQVLPWH
eukprot:TRINITY_DN13575_c0_g1_i1.p1 TRINITY_DN13575_c0_g1~~TRINITY_DN13575_c0_g1_i1.p1  ORF type:complete len:751 (+),score=9.19 TRINITY_DN13575_c0_g1_i1:370-2622(+)